MRHILTILFIPLMLAACVTSPTSGKPIFASLMNSEQENQLGMTERDNVLKQYNGVSDNQAMNAFVNRVAAKLIPHAERKDISWTFTVLNDDIVNAFAVPGGYIYVTRGLLNLAQDESQVAAVLGHEMGHINAMHSAQQMSQTMVANLGLQALSIATGTDAAGQLGGVGADLFLKKYSREHELEADALAVRYLAAAGYDPYANTKFLDLLEKYTELEQRMAGSKSGDQLASFFATHPPTPERVIRARQIADQMPKPVHPVVNRDAYLHAVDGTVYGDPKQAQVNRVRLIRVETGDTPQSLAAKMAVKDHALERFCLLNGITPDEQLKPKNLVKSVQPF